MTDTFACRACGSEDVSQSGDWVSFEELWEALERDFGVSFSAAVRHRHSPGSATCPHHCRRCGVESFHPAVGGDAEFYAILSSSPHYYERDRWEFGQVIRRITRGARVLDVGCGPGRFLERARAAGATVVGVDANPGALKVLAERGIPAYGSLQALHEAGEPAPDVVCAFQTLEHVPDAASFVEDLLGILVPDGTIFISIPNAVRSGRRQLEPLDHPPHHLTRWSADALRSFATRHGLRTTLLAFEPPDVSTTREAVRAGVRSWLGRSLPMGLATLGGRIAGALVASRAAYGMLRRSRRFSHLGLFGHTMVAGFRRERKGHG